MVTRMASKRCAEEGCDKHPSFGSPKDRMSLFCKEHKRDGGENVVNKRCAEEGCDKHPRFGSPEDGIRLFYSERKHEGGVNCAVVWCQHNGCYRPATYGNEADDIPLWCGSRCSTATRTSHKCSKGKVCACRRCGASMLAVMAPADCSFGSLKDGVSRFCR